MHAYGYVAPATVEDAVAVLSEHGSAARVLAGGTDVIIQAREGRRDVGVMVDVKAHPGDRRSSALTADGSLRIGAAAAVRADLRRTPSIARRFPALIDSASLIGGIQIQSRASLGGNLCNSSPAADSIPTLIVARRDLRDRRPERAPDGAGRGVLHRPRGRTSSSRANCSSR